MKTQIRCTLLSENAKLPTRAHTTDSGVDLFSAIDCTIPIGGTVVVPTDISVRVVIVNAEGNELVGSDLPEGYNVDWTLEGHIREKSGLASKCISVGAGVIDNGYTGPIGVVLSYNMVGTFIVNLIALLTSVSAMKSVGTFLQDCCKPYTITKGDKIAQLSVKRVELSGIVQSTTPIVVTPRGATGFGDSGK